MSLRLRPAHDADCTALTDVVFRAKQSNGYDDTFMEACRAELTITSEMLARCDLWLAEDAGKVLGCANLCKEDAERGEVSLFFVDPDVQGRGIGRLLWTTVFRMAHEAGLKTLFLHADPAAVGFYQTLGFKTVGEAPSGSIKGRMLPVMELVL